MAEKRDSELAEAKFVNEVLIDYMAMTERYGPLEFVDFIELSREAEALAREAVELGLSIDDVPLLDVEE